MSILVVNFASCGRRCIVRSVGSALASPSSSLPAPRLLSTSPWIRLPVEANAFGKTEKKSMPDMAPRHFNQPGVRVAEGGAKKTEDLIKSAASKDDDSYTMPHPIWTKDEVEGIEVSHRKPEGVSDRLAYAACMALRFGFDLASGYTIQSNLKTLDERAVLTRVIFLETVAGVPGFSAAMIRHLHSLRRLQRDHGWIHTLLEEAENERMHLMTFLQLRKPGPLFRGFIAFSQGVFTIGFSLAYLVSPTFCHRFVGYLEEQAVVTYTHILRELDAGRLPMWEKLPAPELAVTYWKLPKDALMREVILAIRADEAHHRTVNHTLGSMDLRAKNPFKPGE